MPHVGFGQQLGNFVLQRIPIIGMFFSISEMKKNQAEMKQAMAAMGEEMNCARVA